MADKKTFTIEINGLEKAYDNVIKLRDAIKTIDDIELKIDSENLESVCDNVVKLNNAVNDIGSIELELDEDDVKNLNDATENAVKLGNAIKDIDEVDLDIGGDITIISNSIQQNLVDIAQANIKVEQSYTDLSTSIRDNTKAKSDNAEADATQFGSVNNLKESLKELQEEYNKLSQVERESTKGRELAKSILELNEAIEAVDRRTKEHLDLLSGLGVSLDKVNQRINNAKSSMSQLSDTFSSAGNLLKTFGIESQALNSAIENMAEVTKTLNTVQELSSSLINKDSLAMKLAAQAKILYTAAVSGSSIALKGFRLALASTGIGAIIILVAALVTNFDNIKNTVGEAIGGFDRFDKIIKMIEPVIAGLGDVIIKILLYPLRQTMNAIEGIINVFSIFKNKGVAGFGDAMKAIGDTAVKAGKTFVDSFNVVGNFNKGVQDKMVSDQKKANKKRLEDDAKAKSDFIKNCEEKNDANWKFSKEGIKAYQEYFEAQALLYEKDSEEYAKLMDKKAAYDLALKNYKSGGKSNGSGGKSNGSTRDLKQEAEDFKNLIDDIKKTTQDYQNETIEKEIEFKRKLIEVAANNEINESRKLEIENLKKLLDDQLATQKKALDEQIKVIADKKEAQEKAAEAEITLQKAKLENQKIIAQAEIDAITEVINTRKQAVVDLEEIHKIELDQLNKKFETEQKELTKHFDELFKKNIKNKARTLVLEKLFQEQMKALQEKQEKEEEDTKNKQKGEKEEVTTKVDNGELEKYLARLDMDEKFLEKKQKVTENLQKDNIKRNKAGLIDINATKKNYSEAIQADKEYLEELEKNKEAKIKRIDELILESTDNPKKQKEYLAMKLKILADFEKEEKLIRDRMVDNQTKEGDVRVKFFDDLYEKIKKKWDNINTVMTTVGTALTEGLKNQLDEIKKKQDEITKQYEEAVEKHKKSQEKLKSLEEEAKDATGGRAMVVQEQIARQMEANGELAAQEKDLAKQKEKLEKDAAKKEKQMKKVELAQNLITGVANVALSVTKALTMGPIIGPIMAGIIGATGALQVATISKQIAKLEDGGLIRGKRHAQGGMRIEGTNIEVEGDEFVVNRISTNKNLGLIHYINKNRKELTATDINSYFARNGHRAPAQAPNISGRRMYEQGGMLTNLETVDAMAAPQNDRVLEAISKINFKPVVSVVDITSVQNNLAEVKDIAGA